MHSQTIGYQAIGGSRERLESYGEPTLIEDGVYVRAKQQGVGWDIDGLDSGRGATPYWNIVFCRNQLPSVRGTRWACSVPSTVSVKRQEMSRARRASVRLPWRGNARPAGMLGTLNCDQTGGSLPCGKRQCAKVGTRGYFAVGLSLRQLGWTESLLCRPTFRVARQTEVVFLAPQDAVSWC
jgi:hypothetical protein